MPESYSVSLTWTMGTINKHMITLFTLKRLTVYFVNAVTCRNLLREEQYN